MQDGITAANPNATGTFTWSGIKYLQDEVTYTFVHGKGSSVGGAGRAIGFGVSSLPMLLTTISVPRDFMPVSQLVSNTREMTTSESANRLDRVDAVHAHDVGAREAEDGAELEHRRYRLARRAAVPLRRCDEVPPSSSRG